MEVINFKADPGHDTIDGEDEDLDPELAELDNLSDRSSACDCPAHLHDRETPLYIDKGMSQAFTQFPASSSVVENLRPITAPPSTNLDIAETGETPARDTVTVSVSPQPSQHFTEFPHKCYSYGVLEKKWSL